MKLFACLCLCGLFVQAAAAGQANAIFDRAVQALQSGDYPAAEQGFQTVLHSQPHNLGAIGNLGILYARTNRTDLAVKQYKLALRLSPDDPAILLNLGLAYLKQDRHSLALPCFARIAELDPQHRQARQLLALCRLYTGQIAQGIHDLDQLQAAAPNDEQILFLLGFAHLKNNEPDAAQAVFNRMFEVAGPARANFLLGRACYEAELFPRAEESFLDVQRLDPNFPGLHLELAKLYISQRRNDDAIAQLNTLLKQNADDEEANYFLGSLLVQMARYADAVPYLEQARRLRPDSWAVYSYLGRARLHLDRDPSQGINLLERAVELNPDDAATQYQLARALQSAGRKQAAAEVFARARELKSGAGNSDKIPGAR